MSKCEGCKKYADCADGSGLTWPCGAYAPVQPEPDRIAELEQQNAAMLEAWREACEGCGFNDAVDHSDGCENVMCGAHLWRKLWKKAGMPDPPRSGRRALIDLGVEKIKLDRTATALGAEELLGQLCEECGKLVQAAQEMRRAVKGAESVDDAAVRLTEGCADVALRIDAITSAGIVDGTGVQFIGRYKNGRWYKRTKEAME